MRKLMTIPVLKPVGQPNAFFLDNPKFDHAIRDAQARFLYEKARAFARGLDVLFHGTRHRESVLTSGFLKYGSQGVPFTRSPAVAAHFATLPRDDDEGAGAILVFDRSSLRTRHKLECVDNGWVAEPSKFNEF